MDLRPATLALPLVLAGCAGLCGPGGMPKDVVRLLGETTPGGECMIELDASGAIVAAKASVPLSAVPAPCVEAADRHVPGGKAVGAERASSAGRRYWVVAKEVDGLRHEIIMNEDGSLAGLESALKPGECPQAVVDAAQAAVGGGDLVATEKVSGPEAVVGEDFHVKIRVQGEVLRVSVKADGKVLRVLRKMKAEVRTEK
jgi:hypothetical protein